MTAYAQRLQLLNQANIESETEDAENLYKLNNNWLMHKHLMFHH